MSTFKRYLLKHEYIVNIFFSTYPYARPSVKSQQIGYIGYVDKKKLVRNTFKRLIFTHPFNVKRNYIHILQKGNNFKNISSGRNLFFCVHFWKLTNMPNVRIFCFKAKNNWYIFFGDGNSTCPNQRRKKSDMNRHPEMLSQKFPKTTMLHIWWLEVKKCCC